MPSIVAPEEGPRSLIATDKTPRSMSGVILTDSMEVSETGSNQGVCQIPVTGVYQIPPGFRTCFPRGCGPASVGSQTATTNSWPPDFLRASVMLKLNLSYPP